MILFISSIVLCIGIVFLVVAEDWSISLGLVLIALSLMIGFFLIGTVVPISQKQVVYQRNDHTYVVDHVHTGVMVTYRDSNDAGELLDNYVSYHSSDYNFCNTIDSAKTLIVVKQFNSYGFEVDTRSYFLK